MNTISLAQHVDAYLELRASLGYRLANYHSLLKNFATFVEQRGGLAQVNAETALEWAQSSPRSGPSGHASRLTRIRGFLLYLQAFVPSVQPPGRGLLAAPR